MPQPPAFGSSLRDRWLLDPAVTAAFAGPRGLETRVSPQIYCEHDDVKRLADAVTRLP